MGGERPPKGPIPVSYSWVAGASSLGVSSSLAGASMEPYFWRFLSWVRLYSSPWISLK
jgi:hypothetical protein